MRSRIFLKGDLAVLPFENKWKQSGPMPESNSILKYILVCGWRFDINKAFVGLRSCDNKNWKVNLRRCELAKASSKENGLSSWFVQLVRPAGPSSRSVQQVCPAGPSRPIYTLHLTHSILHNAPCTLLLTYCILNNASYTLHLTHRILHIASYTLYFTYCILYISP